MHLNYICIVITTIRPLKQLISTFWIGVIFLSMVLIVLHRHDHNHDSLKECQTQDHHHANSDDCHYCFLFFQQGIESNPTFHWESRAAEFQLSTKFNLNVLESPHLNTRSNKFLRGPPFLSTSNT